MLCHIIDSVDYWISESFNLVLKTGRKKKNEDHKYPWKAVCVIDIYTQNNA